MSPVFIKYLVYLFHKLKYLHLWQSKGSGFHLWFYLKGNSAHCLVFQKPHKRVRYILQNKQQSSSDASVSGNINRVNCGQTGKGVSEMPHRNIYCLRLDLFCSMLAPRCGLVRVVSCDGYAEELCVVTLVVESVFALCLTSHITITYFCDTCSCGHTVLHSLLRTAPWLGLAGLVLRLSQLEAGSYIKHQEVPIIQLLH